MKKLLLFFALMLSQTAAANEIIIANDRGSVPVAVKIDRKADHVAVPFTVTAEIEQPDERMEVITAAIESIRAALADEPDLELLAGVVSLSPSQSRRKSSSSKYRSVRATVQLLALGALGDQGNLFTLTDKVYQGLSKADLPRDVSVSIGSTGLGVSDPERHRRELLEMIRAQIASTREALGASGAVTIRGLEGPVLASQKSSSEVSLYIAYQIDFTTK